MTVARPSVDSVDSETISLDTRQKMGAMRWSKGERAGNFPLLLEFILIVRACSPGQSYALALTTQGGVSEDFVLIDALLAHSPPFAFHL